MSCRCAAVRSQTSDGLRRERELVGTALVVENVTVDPLVIRNDVVASHLLSHALEDLGGQDDLEVRECHDEVAGLNLELAPSTVEVQRTDANILPDARSVAE